MKNKGYRSIPLSFNRKAVRASASVTRKRNTFHSFTEVEMTEPRKRIRDHFEQTGEKLSLTAYIVACLAQAVKEQPGLNAFKRGNRLFLLENVTISVLMERELKNESVPEPVAISDAQLKTFMQIHGEIREAQHRQGDSLGNLSGLTWIRFIPGFLLKAFIRLADKNLYMARKYGKIAVTSVGMFSSQPVWFIPHGTATVLLTVGSIVNRVVEIEGRFESREHLCLTFSFDHDIIDGAPAARFVSSFCTRLNTGDLLPVH